MPEQVFGTVFERVRPPAGLAERALSGARQGSFWTDDVAGGAATYPELIGDLRADLLVVGGGYTGLWTALLAKQENPESRVVLLEGHEIGWAASGRNGGFCVASLTHGRANGERRWPQELDTLERLGRANLDAIEKTVSDLGLDAQFERTGELEVATEEHQVAWLREEAGPDARFLDTEAVRLEVNSPTYLAGLWGTDDAALVHPARLAHELARTASEAGVEIFEHSPVSSLDAGRRGPVRARTPHGGISAARVALGTNAFPSLIRRYRLHTVPVYDYVLMTEPLTPEQRASIGWSHRQGVGDLANQFHYYRLSADDRILFGGYDAIYHAGGRIKAAYEERPESHLRLAEHFFTTFPQLEDVRFSHRWAGAIDTSTRFCAFYGQAYGGRVVSAAGFTGLGVAATRFAAQVLLDLLANRSTERTDLAMVRETPLPFPPEPFASLGINATRWSLDRADHRHGERNLFLRTLDRAGLGFDS